MSFKLRPYQQEAIDAAIDFVHNQTGRNGLIVAPTGAGKSLYIANIAKALGGKILCLQPSKELLEQNYEKYTSYGLKASIYSASKNTLEIGDVTFATPKSVDNNKDAFKQFEVVIIDEAHLNTKVNGVTHRMLQTINPRKVIGLTATPLYLVGTLQGAILQMMNRSKNSFFKKIIHLTQISHIVEQGYWSKLVYHNRHVDTNMLELNSSGSDFSEQSLMRMYEDNNTEETIIKEVKALRQEKRKSILIFVPTIAQAEDLSRKIPGSVAVHSKMHKKDRDRAVEGFKEGTVDVAINVNVLSVGFDHPGLDAIITARSTASIQIYYQQIGRGCRLAPNKKDCKIVDLAGNTIRFGQVENLSFENFEKHGWGLFNQGRLLTGVPIKDSFKITKEDLSQKFINKQDNHLLKNTRVEFGKHRGKTLEQVWLKEPSYLNWICSSSFEPKYANTQAFKEKVINYVKSQYL